MMDGIMDGMIGNKTDHLSIHKSSSLKKSQR